MKTIRRACVQLVLVTVFITSSIVSSHPQILPDGSPGFPPYAGPGQISEFPPYAGPDQPIGPYHQICYGGDCAPGYYCYFTYGDSGFCEELQEPGTDGQPCLTDGDCLNGFGCFWERPNYDHGHCYWMLDFDY